MSIYDTSEVLDEIKIDDNFEEDKMKNKFGEEIKIGSIVRSEDGTNEYEVIKWDYFFNATRPEVILRRDNVYYEPVPVDGLRLIRQLED